MGKTVLIKAEIRIFKKYCLGEREMRGFFFFALFLLTRVNLNHNSRLKNNNHLRTSEAYMVPLPENMPARLQTCQHMSFSEHAHTHMEARVLPCVPSLPFRSLPFPLLARARLGWLLWQRLVCFSPSASHGCPSPPLSPRPFLPFPIAARHSAQVTLTSSRSPLLLPPPPSPLN